MKEVLKEVPNVLKKQIFKRIGMGIVFALLGVITWIASKEFLFALPCLVAMAVLIVSGLGVLFMAITKRYVKEAIQIGTWGDNIPVYHVKNMHELNQLVF